MKPIVKARYQEHIDQTPMDQREKRVAFAANITKELLEAETDEVKAQVEAYREKHYANGSIKLSDDGSDETITGEDEEQERNEQMQW